VLSATSPRSRGRRRTVQDREAPGRDQGTTSFCGRRSIAHSSEEGPGSALVPERGRGARHHLDRPGVAERGGSARRNARFALYPLPPESPRPGVPPQDHLPVDRTGERGAGRIRDRIARCDEEPSREHTAWRPVVSVGLPLRRELGGPQAELDGEDRPSESSTILAGEGASSGRLPGGERQGQHTRPKGRAGERMAALTRSVVIRFSLVR